MTNPTQVGYISEYPHTQPSDASPAISAGDDGVTLDRLFWEGRRVELEGGRVVIGQVWPSVSVFGLCLRCCFADLDSA
jgi:hypothetical protein